MKLICLQIKCILLMVGTMITLPFAHMAGNNALIYWAQNVTDMYDRILTEITEEKRRNNA